jgi:hypothetical protein
MNKPPGPLNLEYIKADLAGFNITASELNPNTVGIRTKMRMLTAVGWLEQVIDECERLRKLVPHEVH